MNILGLQKHAGEEKALNFIPINERQRGEKEACINIPARSKLRGSCLRSSNVSNDTDKSLRNSNAEISDDAKQQSVVPSSEKHSDIIKGEIQPHSDELNDLLKKDEQSTVTNVSASPISTNQNIYRSRENLSLIDSENFEENTSSMENGVTTSQPSDEELKDFLEYMELGQVHDQNIEYEQDQLRKRTAAELGEPRFFTIDMIIFWFIINFKKPCRYYFLTISLL